MTKLKELHLLCRNNHIDLVDSLQPLASLHTSYKRAGNEDFVESLQQFGSGALSVTKWLGGKAFTLLDKGVRAAGTQLSKTFDDNKTLANRIGSAMKSEETYSFSISESTMGSITATGKWSDFEGDLDGLIKTCELLQKHMSDVKDYLGKELIVARKLKSANNTTSMMAVIREFEALKYPIFALPHKNGEWAISEVLPAGKVLKFKQNGHNSDYSMSGDKPSGESHSLEASKTDIQHILSKITKLNDIHLKVKESYADYLDFVKGWSSVVEEASKGLGETTGVGSQVINEAEAILKGNANALAFYSGFTPRVVSYVDKYIQDVLGVFSKVI